MGGRLCCNAVIPYEINYGLRKMKYSFTILFIIFCNISQAQDIPSQPEDKKLSLNPSIYGVQFDFTTLFLIYEYSGHLDYDIFSAQNGYNSIGVRLSIENYYTGSFGGQTLGSPFTNYNVLFRHSLRGEIFWFDLVGGLSYYQTSASNYYPDEVLLRAGFELSYHFIHNILGLVFKGSTSFKDRTGFIGIGISVGLYKK